jgi:hypothetical protein
MQKARGPANKQAVLATALHHPPDKPDYRGVSLVLSFAPFRSEISNPSFTDSLKFCLHPMYRPVVCTDA